MQDSIENLIYFLVTKLVVNSEAVVVKKEFKGIDEPVCYKVNVDEKDIPRVIGKHGRIAKSIRNIVKSAALKNNVKVLIDIS